MSVDVVSVDVVSVDVVSVDSCPSTVSSGDVVSVTVVSAAASPLELLEPPHPAATNAMGTITAATPTSLIGQPSLCAGGRASVDAPDRDPSAPFEPHHRASLVLIQHKVVAPGGSAPDYEATASSRLSGMSKFA